MTGQQRIEREIKRTKNAYRIFHELEDGQLVLADLKNRCYYHDTTHVPGAPDTSAFREGQRQMLLYILDLVEEIKKQGDK